MTNFTETTSGAPKKAEVAAFQPDESLPTNWLSYRIDEGILKLGQWISWLWLVTIVVVLSNVFSRFIMQSGSIALEELSWHMFGITMILTLGYAVVTDSHVRVDVLREKLPLKFQAWVELLGMVLLFLPILYILIDQMIDYAYRSFTQGEGSQAPSGLPYRFIVKSVIPVGMTLIAIAVVSRALRCCTLLFGFPKAITRPKNKTSQTNS